MKLLLVDLDDTLIDTASFKDSLFNKLATVYELDRERVEEMYQVHKNTLDMDDWINDFTMAFDQDIWFSSKDIIRLGIPITVNQEILDFVKHFSGAKMIFSYGNVKLQNVKVDAANLRDSFDSVLVTPHDKFDLLSLWTTTSQALLIDGNTFTDVVIIDDNEKFIDKVKNNYPWIITALVKQGKIQN